MDYGKPKEKNLAEISISKSTVEKVIDFFMKRKKKELRVYYNHCHECTWRAATSGCPVVRKGEICYKFTRTDCPNCNRNPCICR